MYLREGIAYPKDKTLMPVFYWNVERAVLAESKGDCGVVCARQVCVQTRF